MSEMELPFVETKLPPRDGACKGHPVSWWFPLRAAGGNHIAITRQLSVNVKKAIDICSICNVKEECLTYSLEWEPIGIWGGKTEAERHFVRRERGLELKRDGRIALPGQRARSARIMSTIKR